MKRFFNAKKKIVLISTIALILILIGCLVLPQTFASKEDGGELIERGSFVEETNTKKIVEEENASTQKSTTEQTNTEAEKTNTNEPAKTITKTVYGKKVVFKYQSTEKKDGFLNEINDRLVYLSDNNEELVIDSKTKEIISIEFKALSKDSSNSVKTTQKEAEQIAQDFAKQYCDLSDYDKVEIKELSSEFILSYTKTISGFNTSRYVYITIKGPNVTSFYMTPDMFKGIDTSKISITEEEIIQKVKHNYAQKHGDKFFDLELYSVTITVKDEKPQARVSYEELDEQGNVKSAGKLVQTYIDLS